LGFGKVSKRFCGFVKLESGIFSESEYNGTMGKPILQKSFKLIGSDKRQEKAFTGITPAKITILKPDLFINPTEAIRLIRAGK
jgi:hypothetical protein